MHTSPDWLAIVPAAVIAVAMPVAIIGALAVASGWRQRAAHFPDVDSGDGTARPFGSARLSRGRFPVAFENSASIRTTPRGVLLSALLSPITFGAMRAFFVPWVEIERVERKKGLFGESLKLGIRGYGGSITLVGRIAQAFAAAFKEPA